jgi:branched-chain amino acid transport system substrate-binding protein
VAEGIRGNTFKTAIGDLGFDKKGDITRADYVVYTWKKVGDKITYVQN